MFIEQIPSEMAFTYTVLQICCLFQTGTPQENLNALQRAIDSMEEKGLQEDPRYSQLLALRARQAGPVEPGPGPNPARTIPVIFFECCSFSVQQFQALIRQVVL